MSVSRPRCVFALIFLVANASAADAPQPLIQDDGREHWAFKAPTRPVVPIEKGTVDGRNPIDSFIRTTLSEFGLSLGPEADRSTLLRRLSFDLTGLPPSLEDLDRFLNDRRPDAYERVVDRLLADPAYSQRQAQHWLDLARYADTDGFEFDQVRPSAWRYRDWVVDALNQDMPYDRFLREQIAGDEVAPNSPSAFIATGFNRCYPDMVDQNDQGLRRQNALNDITDTTSLVFLGLTIGCARCHDHKTDPIRQVDYYRLQAVFTPAQFRDDYPIGSAPLRREQEAALEGYQSRRASLLAALIRLEEPIRRALTPSLSQGLSDEAVAAIRKLSRDRTDAEVILVYETLAKDKRIKASTFDIALGQPGRHARASLLTALKELNATLPPPLPTARGIDEVKGDHATTFLLVRGEFGRKGERVEPGVPLVLETYGTPASRPTADGHSGRRTALSAWLTDPRNPLTARVMVNRVWQMHFGRGIVASPSDFGRQGVAPTHPELLDWLATEFMNQGWALKSLHRLIVTSATYRQTSRSRADAMKADPENSLFWRQNRRRLDGEAIRDALLSVSGNLNRANGGPPVFPKLPAELTKLSGKGEAWPVSPKEEDRSRRSLYVFIRRNLRYPFFEVFDRPDTNASCPRRAVSTIAPQALTLFNGEFSQDAARRFAERVHRSTNRPDAQVELLFRIALGRLPDAEESKLALEFLGVDGDNERLADLALSLVNLNEFVYVD